MLDMEIILPSDGKGRGSAAGHGNANMGNPPSAHAERRTKTNPFLKF
jgi:hypothetical protein